MNLNEIVEQLERCGFECEAGPLENNTAFIALKELAESEDFLTTILPVGDGLLVAVRR